MLAYRDGDEEAFTLLFKRYELRIFNYILRHVGNRALAEDIFQNTFLKLHRSRKSYQQSAAFSTWIFTIASNLLKDAARVQKRRADIVELEEVRERVAGGSSLSEPLSIPRQQDPEVEVGEREIAAYIRQAVQALPFDQREVIILAKYGGFKYEEIAEILNTTPGAVKVRVHRAIKTLEKAMKDRLGAHPL